MQFIGSSLLSTFISSIFISPESLAKQIDIKAWRTLPNRSLNQNQPPPVETDLVLLKNEVVDKWVGGRV